MSARVQMAELIRRAHFLRNGIISSYAHVEFLLTELNVRSRQLPEYAEIAAGFPYRLESKIARVKELVTGLGPLNKYADDLLALVDRLSVYEELRQFMAHGLMVVSTRETATAPIVFRTYRMAGKTGEEYGAIETDADQLANAAEEISEYTRQIATVIAQIFQELSLEPGAPLEVDV
jgi:hypothetical protein